MSQSEALRTPVRTQPSVVPSSFHRSIESEAEHRSRTGTRLTAEQEAELVGTLRLVAIENPAGTKPAAPRCWHIRVKRNAYSPLERLKMLVRRLRKR